jgi:hypothetical protein
MLSRRVLAAALSVIGGVPIATNQADLADPTKYQCIAAKP